MAAAAPDSDASPVGGSAGAPRPTPEQQAAAVKVQKLARGFMARKQKFGEVKTTSAAAVKLQGMARGFFARRRAEAARSADALRSEMEEP